MATVLATSWTRAALAVPCAWLALASLAACTQAQGQEATTEAATAATATRAPEDASGALEQYQAIKEGLRRNRQEMCAFLLADIDNQNEVLDLAKVTYLFEGALDHLARSAEYVGLMRPHVDPQVVSNFDAQGGGYVLEISEARRRLIEEYERAVRAGASDLKLRNLLEAYFYKACEFKLATVVAEKAMYESVLKAERSLRMRLLPGRAQR